MFATLFASGTVIQVFQADALAADPRNSRTLYASFSAERGPILIDGQPIAESTPVDTEFRFQRVYNNGALYAPVTGYFTLNQGRAGIENSLNDFLSGTANEQFLDNLTAIFTGQSPKGAAVELTIDPVVQQAAWDAMGDNSGAIVAIDPKTGAILAMVSKQSYDPNLLAGHDSKIVIENYNALDTDPNRPLLNRAIGGDLYHPGSVFKIVVAAAAFGTGLYTPDSVLPNPASITLPQSSSIVTNSSGAPCGAGDTVTIATALRLSCNIPFAELGLLLGEDVIAAQAAAFGYGDDFEVPMAVTPSTYPEGLDDAQLMLSAFGQYDDRVTALQVAMTSAAIANGGVLMKPSLVESIIAPDLSVIQSLEPAEYGRPVSTEIATTIRDMMVNGVANGAASNARISGVDVAGKTGTAENGSGVPYTLWFTGFAPAEDPQVAVAVVVENGGGMGQSSFGNAVAAPIAKKVLEAVLNR
jgi:peptidoglycan glycosyltransferase